MASPINSISFKSPRPRESKQAEITLAPQPKSIHFHSVSSVFLSPFSLSQSESHSVCVEGVSEGRLHSRLGLCAPRCRQSAASSLRYTSISVFLVFLLIFQSFLTILWHFSLYSVNFLRLARFSFPSLPAVTNSRPFF